MKKIVILYNHFLPAYKSGGPIQSIANLVRNLYSQFDFFIITTNLDSGSDTPIDVKANSWQDFENGKAKVFYLNKEHVTFSKVISLIKELNPNIIYLNGLYSMPFAIIPALYFRFKVVMHIRGMLHPGAMAQKPFKKRLFLAFFKFVGIHKKIHFCVSDELEKAHTQEIFGVNCKIHITQNFPAYFDSLKANITDQGLLKLMSIALISPIKNHHLVLEALALVKKSIIWYIYGPIKDEVYWGKCDNLIKLLPDNIKIKYMGDINPTGVYDALATCDFFILPSASENFGHALYEAMIAGKPIITSHNTPWNLLEGSNAGFNVALHPESIALAIEKAAALNQIDYINMVCAVRKYAELAINRDEIKMQHLELFNSIS